MSWIESLAEDVATAKWLEIRERGKTAYLSLTDTDASAETPSCRAFFRIPLPLKRGLARSWELTIVSVNIAFAHRISTESRLKSRVHRIGMA